MKPTSEKRKNADGGKDNKTTATNACATRPLETGDGGQSLGRRISAQLSRGGIVNKMLLRVLRRPRI
jgi:hypothetical protein